MSGQEVDDHTPTMGDLREAYVASRATGDSRGLPSSKHGEAWARAEFDRTIADHDRKVSAQALREWIASWPAAPGDGTFLADVARAGMDRADRIEAGGPL